MVALKILTKKKKNDLSTNARNFADETMETTGFKGEYRGLTSLVVQWIRLCAPNAGGPGSIPGRGSRSGMHPAIRVLMLQLRPGAV